jgi:hypothetical protein
MIVKNRAYLVKTIFMLLIRDDTPTSPHATWTLQLTQHCSATNDKRDRGPIFKVIFAIKNITKYSQTQLFIK